MSDEMREKVAEIIEPIVWRLVAVARQAGLYDDEMPCYVDVLRAREKADVILSLFTAELERVERERDEARAGLAYVLDHAEYGNSYGVHGSDFTACHFCHGGGAPGVEMIHDSACPVAKYPNAVEEWFGEMADAEARATAAEARLDEAVEVMREVEPFIDAIVCYASSIDEYEPNRIAKRLHDFMEQQGD